MSKKGNKKEINPLQKDLNIQKMTANQVQE